MKLYLSVRVFFNISFICFILNHSGLSAVTENSITGHVYDRESGKPLENVNIYISNSTWGSSTDAEGSYKILKIPAGSHELVVSIVGYEYETKKIFLKSDSKLIYDFRLKPVIYEAESTVVEGSIPDAWYRDLAFFKRHFLGQTVYADDCVIENEIYLNFVEPNDVFFLASADRPLIIKNQALGYQIECILVHFSYNYDSRQWSWSIKPKFTDQIAADSSQAMRWKQNREDAYRGSLYHFLKSFHDRDLAAEKFNIYRVPEAGQKVPMLNWHQTIIDYEDYISPGASENEEKLHFSQYLYVVYEQNLASWIGLNYSDITLDEYGYAQEDNPYVIYGYWAFKGVGDLLPKNYLPR
jgi:hypothetical protein